MALADRRRGARAHDPAGVVHPALGGGDPLRGRAARDGHARRRAERAGGQRAGPGDDQGPARRGRAGRAAGGRGALHLRHALRARPHHAPQPAADGAPGWTTSIDGPEGWVFATESRDDLGRITITADIAPGAAAAHGQAARLRLVQRALAPVGARPGRRGAGRRPQVRLGRAGQGAARVPRRVLGQRRRRARGRHGAPAGGPLLDLPRDAGGRPRRAAGDPGQGADRPGLRRPLVLGLRELRAPAAHLHGARRGGRRAALALVDAGPRDRARARRCTWRAPRSRGARSAGRSARATGRPARPRSTSTPASRRR